MSQAALRGLHPPLTTGRQKGQDFHFSGREMKHREEKPFANRT
jgi:hypothetical protein